ncbi:endonuclease domain-containing protein [Fimbriimonas ginsengisoli]|uniref:endonuclease domain-containing protein n=1 Tax=Fimbriimonas ginsengisoli TaxID=1005039 RepID=UPI00046D7EB0|nr:DUF559 domain-containing protein [Fimbriimonas ginsengisoli]
MRKHRRSCSEGATERARQLRQEMTSSEKRLWKSLRDRRLEFKFRRQYPIGPYTLDFFCPEAGICIEVDGDSHIGREARDAFRDQALLDHGIVTIRIALPTQWDWTSGTSDG